MWPCPERKGVTMGCLYPEIEGQSCLVGSVDQGLHRQIDLPGRMTKKEPEQKTSVIFPHSDVTRNLLANNPPQKIGNFLAFLTFWPNYRLSIVIGLKDHAILTNGAFPNAHCPLPNNGDACGCKVNPIIP